MILLENKKARYEYEILETYLAGVVLTGGETKSIRLKKGSLVGSFIKLVGQEAVLINVQIPQYVFASQLDYDPKRTRKLLLHRKELLSIGEKIKQKGITLIPLAFEADGKYIKLRFGAARGKKQYEKRRETQERDLKRKLQREFKTTVRV